MTALKEFTPIRTDLIIDEEILKMKSLSKYTKTYNTETRPRQSSISQRFHNAVKNFLKKHFPNAGRFPSPGDNIDEYHAQVKDDEVIIRASIFEDPYNLNYKKCVEIKINLQNYSFTMTKQAIYNNYNNVKVFLDFK